MLHTPHFGQLLTDLFLRRPRRREERDAEEHDAATRGDVLVVEEPPARKGNVVPKIAVGDLGADELDVDAGVGRRRHRGVR